MSQSIRYVSLTDDFVNVYGLGRIINDGDRLWGEEFHEGQWIRYDRVLDALFSPGGFAEVISNEEAKVIAKRLGILIQDP